MWRSNPATAGSRFAWTLVLVSSQANWRHHGNMHSAVLFFACSRPRCSHTTTWTFMPGILFTPISGQPTDSNARFLRTQSYAITCYLSSLWVFIFLAGFDWRNTQWMHTKSWNTGVWRSPPSPKPAASCSNTLFQMHQWTKRQYLWGTYITGYVFMFRVMFVYAKCSAKSWILSLHF